MILHDTIGYFLKLYDIKAYYIIFYFVINCSQNYILVHIVLYCVIILYYNACYYITLCCVILYYGTICTVCIHVYIECYKCNPELVLAIL